MNWKILDEFNLNKEKAEIAASISKSDLCSDLVNEYPDLQGLMGKYFAISQGFEEDVSNAISDHYLPLGNNSTTSKKPISYVVAIADKIGCTPAQVAIKFCYDSGCITIPKSSRPERIVENFASLDVDISSEMDAIKALECDYVSGWDPTTEPWY